MTRGIAVAAALSLLVAFAGDASAKTRAKKHKRYTAEHHYSSARTYSADGYVERDVNKLPFGSAIWWDQMRREGRLGGETP